jgi:tRNA dimethylallyltransferase
MIIILGPTASGKTVLAARLAYELGGEVISADSRQVYRGMDIGTGKDLDDYLVKGTRVPVHLVDIVDPGYEYNIFEYQQDFRKVYLEITGRGKKPILCGGSGMYIEAILKRYDLKKIVNDPHFKEELEQKSDEELKEILQALRITHNTTDLTDRQRTIRAIEIASISGKNRGDQDPFPAFDPVLIGIRFEREILRTRITERLNNRLLNGMIEEVKALLDKGLTADQLKFYGLEYRYITQYLEEELDYDNMFMLLNTAIHQFAKRQMTWFRRMERNGSYIHWIDGTLDQEKKTGLIKAILDQSSRHPATEMGK